jgi:DNA modification methylase
VTPHLDDGDVRIWLGDAIDCLRAMPAGSAQTCITSPPFWGLRDYGTGRWDGGRDDCDHKQDVGARKSSGLNGSLAYKSGEVFVPYRDVCGKCGARRVDQQIGLEETPDQWVARLVDVFREVRRVLRDDGTLWLEVGDSYNANQGSGFKIDGYNYGGADAKRPEGTGVRRVEGIKPKDLVGAPWLLAFALRADGWYLRSDIIWARPNPMPESVTDRPTKSHSYVFLPAKTARRVRWPGLTS